MDDAIAPLILVVDDDPTNRLLLSKILSKSGYRVAEADCGAVGLAYLEDAIPDLILLNVRMPEMDGFEVCRRLKAVEATAEVPVIFITAEGRSDENVSEGFGAGACDYITKPFSRVDVLVRIQLTLKQRAVEETYKKLASKDPLTGLDNRRRLYERLAGVLSEATRRETLVSVAMIDLDKFKAVNDAHGHDLGDKVLKGFAELLQTHCRLEDVVCRFGGEEFLVVMPATESDGAFILAERLREKWEQTVFETPEGDQIRVTASFGLAISMPTEGPADGDDLIKRADQALYAAKEGGRNRIVRFEDLERQIVGL